MRSDEEGTEPGYVRSDDGRLPEPARRALASLLTSRFITRTKNRAAWDGLLDYPDEIEARLADMYLDLVVDRDYDVAFKRQVDDEAAPVLLRRDKPLSRDASFLLILLRREHAYTDATDDPVVLSHDQIADYLRPFRQSGDHDDAKFDRRVETAIRALSDLGLLSQDPEADFLFVVSPAVVPLVSLEVLARMEQTYLDALSNEVPADQAPPEDGQATDPPEGAR